MLLFGSASRQGESRSWSHSWPDKAFKPHLSPGWATLNRLPHTLAEPLLKRFFGD